MRGAALKLRGHPMSTRPRAARSSLDTSSRWLETVNAIQGGWRTARFSTFRNILKEQYQDLAVNFARNASRERDLDGKQTSYAEPRKEN
jgi:hypothetical protein